MSSLWEQLRAAEEAHRKTGEEVSRLRKLQRRESQEKDLAEGSGSADRPVSWMGDILMFVEDLAYHTARLGRPVYGDFNGHRIVTDPGLEEKAAAVDAYHQWCDQFLAEQGGVR